MKKLIIYMVILSLLVVPVLGQVSFQTQGSMKYTITHSSSLGTISPSSAQVSFQTANQKSDIQDNIQIDRVFFPDGEYIDRDQSFRLAVDVDSDLRTRLRDVSVSVHIPDLGVYVPGGKRELERNDKDFWIVALGPEDFRGIPENVLVGDHLVRIVVSNDDFRKLTHRVITIR